MLPDGCEVMVARSRRARLLGLAFLTEPPPRPLLLPRCSCVHTFGMRFALDVEFLDARGRRVQIRRAVPPRRLVRCHGASAVLETARSEPGC